MNNGHQWIQPLLTSIRSELEDSSNDEDFMKLPQSVRVIPDEFKSGEDSQVEWLIYGALGVSAYAIGVITDGSVMNEQPVLLSPTLLLTLSSLGGVYSYSQIAVLIVPYETELTESTKIWIQTWSEEGGSVRRIVIYQEEHTTIEQLSRYVVRNVLSPWQTLMNVGELHGE